MKAAEAHSAAVQSLRDLPLHLQAVPEFRAVVAALRSGTPCTFDNTWGSGCALLAAALAREQPPALLAVLPNPKSLEQFSDHLELFAPEFGRFPPHEAEPGELVVCDEFHADRLRLVKQLGGPQPPRIIATNIQALLQPVPPRSWVAENTRRIRVGQTLPIEDLARWLAEHRLHATTAVELPGEFSRRGGILDVFALDWLDPVRIEFFGDEIESLRRFEVASQRSLDKLAEIEITVAGAAGYERALLAEHLPAGAWVLLFALEQMQLEGRLFVERAAVPGNLHSVQQVWQSLAPFPTATAAHLAEGAHAVHCHLPLVSVDQFARGDLAALRSELDRAAAGYLVHVVAQTDGEIERLGEVLAATEVCKLGTLQFSTGVLHEGFRLTAGQTLVLGGRELFQREELRRPPRRFAGKAIDSFLDLREGDLVVHLAHGIGRYRGLKLIVKQDQAEEHLELEFAEQTKIYVPAAKIHLVQKYVGGTGRRPTLAKIGGQAWVKQKKAAEIAVTDLAAELLDVQAARRLRPGIAFHADSDWQREFEASFPYAETPDQLTAIVAIKGDMQTPRPMDRLLCGDVGFGKTELAMRAAFKAVENGYQVAMLVPTTLLAEQHYRTFRERMAEFPFEIAKLSRFCTPAEERDAVAGLAAGRIDIVIGTHRLASADVQFFNLGLVIIDEEQRFGVDVKERLKTLRTTVDVLTLSATPIPRTLHMSLVGVRDISNLETPPQDRHAVETRVSRFDPQLVRHAILREMNRGGQAYFVHNRVADIGAIAQRLRSIVPEAALRVGHGQMPEHELEEVMVDFVAGKFDVLLATTIVESGLDIPNANTIFIHEANRYGLADLHQLRGRVGRSHHRGYCYLLLEPHQRLTADAGRRLRAIEEYSHLGAGFSIAMRDLEIRGAGNLLGTQQSGHIAAVGYEFYCELLENAVRQLKSLPPKLAVDVDIDLPGEAFFPDDYVTDIRAKMNLYRRLARAESFSSIADLRTEMHDRFGPLPPPVERLLQLTELRLEAAVWQIAAITVEDKYLVFRYANRQRIEQLAKLHGGGKLRVVDEQSAYATLLPAARNAESLLRIAFALLRPSAAAATGGTAPAPTADSGARGQRGRAASHAESAADTSDETAAESPVRNKPARRPGASPLGKRLPSPPRRESS